MPVFPGAFLVSLEIIDACEGRMPRLIISCMMQMQLVQQKILRLLYMVCKYLAVRADNEHDRDSYCFLVVEIASE